MRADIVLAAVVGIALFILCFLSVKYSLYTLIFAMLLSPQLGERTTEGGGVTIRLDDFMLIIIAFSWFARTAIYKEMPLLKTLVETGIFGFLSFLYLLYVLLRETRKVYTSAENKFLKGIAMGFFAGILAMMTHAIGANTFIIVRIMKPFWFLAAIVVSIPQIYKLEKFGDSDSLRSEIKKPGYGTIKEGKLGKR